MILWLLAYAVGASCALAVADPPYGWRTALLIVAWPVVVGLSCAAVALILALSAVLSPFVSMALIALRVRRRQGRRVPQPT